MDSIRGVPLWQRPPRNSLTAQVLSRISGRTAAPVVRRLAVDRWSAKLTEVLRQAGFDDVINLLEGFSVLDLDHRWTRGPWLSPREHLIDAMALYLQAHGIDVPLERRKPVLPGPAVPLPASAEIVLNPNAGSSLKEAPVQLWVGLAHHLLEAGYVPLVLRGPEGGLSEEINRRAPRTRLIATPSVPALIRLLTPSRLVISPDTGVLHLAAALGVPYVGLFGATEPRFLGPYGASENDIVMSPAQHTEVCRGCWAAQLLPHAACSLDFKPGCLSSVRLDDVIPAVASQLARARTQPHRGERLPV